MAWQSTAGYPLGGGESVRDEESAGSGDDGFGSIFRDAGSSWGSPQAKAGIGCCGCLCLTFLICILASIAGLHATKLAITRNTITGVVNFDTTYHGGRHLIGFWNSYLEFPGTIQSVEWLPGRPLESSTRDLSQMNVRTSDGLMVELGIVAQYKVVEDKIPEMYRSYKTDYEAFFISNLRSALQSKIAMFKATDLYSKRFEVDNALLDTCHKVCEDNLHGFLSCWGIQLMDVNLDPRIEKANINQQVERQKQSTESMKQQASLVRSKTKVMESDFIRQVKIVNVEADAEAVNITKKARSDAEFNVQSAKAAALNVIQNTLKSGGAAVALSHKEILKYLEDSALIDSTGGAMVYGDFQSATIFANSASGGGRSSGLSEL